MILHDADVTHLDGKSAFIRQMYRVQRKYVPLKRASNYSNNTGISCMLLGYI